MTHNSTIHDLLTRGVANIIPGKEELEQKLLSGDKLKIYFGIDPTATKIHIGHAFPLRKLQKFAELGHQVTFLIGDFTALIGDTSDKESERPVLTSEQIEANFQTYKRQAQKFLDFDKIIVRHNSEWLSKLSFKDIIQLCYHFSAGDFYSRELIKKRLTNGDHVGLHELLYPVMQGYDSYFMDTDMQIGGTDQTFNMQAGRILQKDLRNKQSFVMSNVFLSGTDGRKMSKTWGNGIWLEDEPNDVYGKVMSLRDDLIIEYFTLATNLSITEIEELKIQLETRNSQLETNPMVVKKRLAWQITSELHNEAAADAAQAEFEKVYQNKDLPTEIPVFQISRSEWNPLDLLLETKLEVSKSDARRLIEQGGFKINNQTVSDWTNLVIMKSGDILQAGKHRFVRVKI